MDVGEGRRIKCEFDPWIPGCNSFHSIIYKGPADDVVSSLITDERQWNMDLRNQFFSHLDVERIMTLPLSFFPSEDSQIRHYNEFGLPTFDELKLNFDAVVHSSRNKIGVGALVRNARGKVLAAMSKPSAGNFKSHEMEATTMFHSLNWVMQLELPISTMEIDAQMVSNTLTK
uniref:RNase H type-1 domain-containing protein n=1 Tax=Cannabis sativa TaxID=3483 RepID=A0A803PUT4_CANSA